MDNSLTLWQKLINSFDNKNDGLSKRALSAFAGVVIGIVITYQHSNPINVHILLATWLLFSLLCMGLITMQQITELKTGVITSKKTEVSVKETVTENQPVN